MDTDKIIGLILLCAPLSLLSFGGGQSIVVGLHNQVVDANGWMSNEQFTDLFAISKAAPGPGALITALVGWQVAGLFGAIVATVGIFLPSSLLIGFVGGWWEKHRRSRLTVAIEKGLLPIAVGLIFAGSFTIATFSTMSVANCLTIAATFAVLWFTKVGPYPILVVVTTLYLLLSTLGIPA